MPVGLSAWTKTAAPSDSHASKNGIERRVADRHAVDVAADLDADESGQRHEPAQLGDRQVEVLQRHGAQADQRAARLVDHRRDALVEVVQQLERIGCLHPVGEQLGHRRDRLPRQAHRRQIGEPPRRRPRLVADGAVELAGDHHVAMALVRRRHRRPLRRRLAAEVRREVLRNDVRVNVETAAPAARRSAALSHGPARPRRCRRCRSPRPRRRCRRSRLRRRGFRRRAFLISTAPVWATNLPWATAASEVRKVGFSLARSISALLEAPMLTAAHALAVGDVDPEHRRAVLAACCLQAARFVEDDDRHRLVAARGRMLEGGGDDALRLRQGQSIHGVSLLEESVVAAYDAGSCPVTLGNSVA